jgi:hypothetical protein
MMRDQESRKEQLKGAGEYCYVCLCLAFLSISLFLPCNFPISSRARDDAMVAGNAGNEAETLLVTCRSRELSVRKPFPLFAHPFPLLVLPIASPCSLFLYVVHIRATL